MTSNQVKLMIISFAASLGIAYAWWTVLRVMRLRQDLLMIRDGLFDGAASMGRLDHPAHKAARDSLNILINMADILSIPTIVYLFVNRDSNSVAPPEAEHKLKSLIEETMQKTFQRLAHYLLRESITGWICRVVYAGGTSVLALQKTVENGLRGAVLSGATRHISNHFRPV